MWSVYVFLCLGSLAGGGGQWPEKCFLSEHILEMWLTGDMSVKNDEKKIRPRREVAGGGGAGDEGGGGGPGGEAKDNSFCTN